MVRSAHEQHSIAPDGQPMRKQPAWRQDFSIDVTGDEFIARRDFTKFMVLISAAFACGQFWIVFENARRKRRGAPPVREIAKVSQLAVGQSLVFAYPTPSENCLLVRRGENEFVAFSQKCTHLSCAVRPRPEEGIFHCPCHEGIFDMATGRPLAGPPRRALPRVTLKIRDGVVYATGMEA